MAIIADIRYEMSNIKQAPILTWLHDAGSIPILSASVPVHLLLVLTAGKVTRIAVVSVMISQLARDVRQRRQEGSLDLALTQCMVKDVHPAAAGHLQQQLLHQRVVSRMHLQPCVAARKCNTK